MTQLRPATAHPIRGRVHVATAALVVLSGLGFARDASADAKPNIIFLMADDQCTNSLGCYGTQGVRTPHLDQLAKDGIVFDNHYDTTAICMASRANVMTGMYEFKTGCNFGHGALLRQHWSASYPMRLKQAGYNMAFAGKFGFEVTDRAGTKGQLPEHDFDRWGGGPGQTSYVTRKNKSIARYADDYPHSTLAYGAFGRDFIREATRQTRPFCLSISFKAPHRPVAPDPKFDDIYRGKSFVKPENYGRQHGKHFSRQSRQGRQYARFSDWNYDTDYDGVMAKYHQQVYAIDVAVGMIRQALVDSNTAGNTVVIYTSDNGFLCGAHGYGSKVLPYEESSRVPLIIYDPRHANSGKQLRCPALTGNIDFAPTILALAGLPIPDNTDGRNLLPLYDDPQADVRQSLALINVWGPAEAHSLSVLTKHWKYIYWSYAAGDFSATEELYHTGRDPLELTNLAVDAAYRAQLTGMRARYDTLVQTWKKESVPYHGYQPFGTIFDRQIPWNQKRALLTDPAKKQSRKR